VVERARLISSLDNHSQRVYTLAVGHQIENPFVALSRLLIQAYHAVTEPLFKTRAEVFDTTVNTYETGLAGPARRSVLEINKKVMDTIISN
jgi:hypothetical protein